MVSVGAEDEDGTVFEGDFDWLWDAGRWSKQSKLGSASSSGIHSRMACHGGSMGSKVSISKGGRVVAGCR